LNTTNGSWWMVQILSKHRSAARNLESFKVFVGKVDLKISK
jgi:hypothetical protein